MDDKEVAERLAVLETKLKDHVQQADERLSQLQDLAETQEAILRELARARGWVGGALWIAGALIAGLKLFGETIRSTLMSVL